MKYQLYSYTELLNAEITISEERATLVEMMTRDQNNVVYTQSWLYYSLHNEYKALWKLCLTWSIQL